MGQCASNKSSGIHFNKKKKRTKPFEFLPFKKDMEKGSECGEAKKLTRGQAMSFGFRRPTTQRDQTKKPPVQQVTVINASRKNPPVDQGAFRKGGRSEHGPSSLKTPSEHVKLSSVTVQETIKPLHIAPVQPKTTEVDHPKEKPVNRFGFGGPPFSNKVADVAASVNSPAHCQERSRKYKLECSELPRAQYAIRGPVSGGFSADKRTKTAVNTALSHVAPSKETKLIGESNCSDTAFEIHRPRQSPLKANKHKRTQLHLQLQHEQYLQQMVDDDHQLCEEPGGSRIEEGAGEGRLSALQTPASENIAFSLDDGARGEGFDDTSTEEKQKRDKETNEKDSLGSNEGPSEELWGPGEAMATEEDVPGDPANVGQSAYTPPLRSVLLRIEDPTFAPLAALSQSALLEDETQPESPDISCSSPSSVDPLPPPPVTLSAKGSPASTGTPTRETSLSGSDTRDRDFLIDDEIADQPGLVFDHCTGQRLLDASKKMSKLADEVSEALASMNLKITESRPSISSLSSCDSLISDDLMADFDSSDFSNVERMNISCGMLSGGSSGPHIDSPQFINTHVDCNGIVSISIGEDGSDDSGIRVDKGTYQDMFHDVVNIKSMLARLQNILLEGGVEKTCQEEEGEKLADLRRQVVLLNAQLDERNRRIGKLEEELLSRHTPLDLNVKRTATNKAAQTDRIPPVSTSQALFQCSPDNSTSSFVRYL